jgi:two-component system, cell cycle response regulator
MSEAVDRTKIRNPGMPILCVDDDPIAHMILRRYLNEWQITCVYSAKDALDALERENFVIVITDLMMPGMNGLELLTEIKQRYGNRVQVIVVTASDHSDNLVRALDGGASDFILKPYKKEDIEEVLQHTLSRLNRWKQCMNILVSRKRGGPA